MDIREDLEEAGTLYYEKDGHIIKLPNRIDSLEVYDCDTKYGHEISIGSESSFELNADEVTLENIRKLFCVDMDKLHNAYDVEYIESVQARKHKKKRINKKWLKRYGHRQVKTLSKGWQLKTYIDGTFEFAKE